MLVLGTPNFQAFDNNGDPLSGGLVYTYAAGTLIAKATYPTVADATALTNANTNPVVLNSRGEAAIVLNGSTKVILKTSSGTTIYTFDALDSGSGTIFDSNGNELLKFTETASAVNELTLANAATGNNPVISATGGDSNIGLTITPKGNGGLTLTSGALTLTSGNLGLTSGNATLTSGNLTLTNGNLTLTSGDLTMTSGNVIGNVTMTTGNLVLSTGNMTLTAGNFTMTDTSKTHSLIPAGCVQWYAGSSAPSGWLECDGSAISRTTYAALFAAIGTAFGVGDGSTTFNLPDQARRTLVGKGGAGTATLANTIGSTGGAETHTLVTGEMPAHTHSYGATQAQGTTSGNVIMSTSGSTYTTSSTGGGGAHNNMQPSLVMMMIMRAY